MAETLTFENTTEATSVDNLNADEQNSLEVGEKMQAAEDTRLAGKYESAQELEKAYIELEKKLGEKSEGDSEEQVSDEPQAEEKTEEKEESNPTAALLEDLYEQATSGKDYSKETLEQLSQSKPEDIANLYLEYRNEQEKNPAEPASKDFSEADVKELKGVVGGDENYNNMLTWAKQNLNEQEIGMFDQVMGRGDPLSAFFAIRSLAYRYNDAIGYDGKMVTGKAPKQGGEVFRSQAEVVKAMQDSRYDRDPAYRRDIQDKLERSDIKF